MYAVLVLSAAGILTPSFFTVAEKRKSSDCYFPVTGSFTDAPRGIIEEFSKLNWFPSNGYIAVTDNVSMEGPVLHAFFQHIQHTARHPLVDAEVFLLFRDGNSSINTLAGLKFAPEWN